MPRAQGGSITPCTALSRGKHRQTLLGYSLDNSQKGRDRTLLHTGRGDGPGNYTPVHLNSESNKSKFLEQNTRNSGPSSRRRTGMPAGEPWDRCVLSGSPQAAFLTLSLVSVCARFLWIIRMYPGGWIQASPSTCTGTPSSPRMEIFTVRH